MSQLYAGAGNQFITDVIENRIAEKLEHEFIRAFGHRPGQGEIRSWQNSLRAVVNVMAFGGLNDVGVALEYQLPQSSRRLDLMLTGHDRDGQASAVVVELKQWDRVEPSAVTECVVTFVGGRERDVLHPSVQTSRYVQYLEDFRTVFSCGDVTLTGCSYLHNLQLERAAAVQDAAFSDVRTAFPCFTGDQSRALSTYLQERVGHGDGLETLRLVQASPYRASKRLLEHTASTVAGQDEFVLIDDQRVAFNAVVDAVQDAFHASRKVIFVIRGGPGTGKSVIALQLIGSLSQRGYNALHATGSKAFTENLRRIVGTRAGNQFRYFNSFADAEPNAIDVLVLDEAHRIRESSRDRYRPQNWSGLPQIDELIRAAKVCVFFIDELQVVRPSEVGSVSVIEEAAARAEAQIHELSLESQFRCGGSEGFIAWTENTLGIRETANEIWEGDPNFELKIVGSVQELDDLIRQRAAEGHTARLSAGFCWPWSSPLPDGTLVRDVVVGEWSRPWNAKSGAGKLAKGIPKENFWASDPRGIDQVGCIYTAQGFEYDYAGVIWGMDLRYEPELADWRGYPQESADNTVKRAKEGFLPLVKQTYRVLLTRGLKGCYIYCQDPKTRTFLESRIGT